MPARLLNVPHCRKLASICDETLPTLSRLLGKQRNMESNAGFILKVLIASTAISVAIKYAGAIATIRPAPNLALIAVLLPTVIMAIALLWRSQQQKSEG